jgi:hypothetical protein
VQGSEPFLVAALAATMASIAERPHLGFGALAQKMPLVPCVSSSSLARVVSLLGLWLEHE